VRVAKRARARSVADSESVGILCVLQKKLELNEIEIEKNFKEI
jgi:hypothetical protein